MQVAADEPAVRLAGGDPGRRAGEGEGRSASSRPSSRASPRRCGARSSTGRWRSGQGVCLLDQVWVKDEKKKDIRALLTDLVAKTGENVKVRRFVRFEVGEGLEKRTDDFVAEVAEAAGPGLVGRERWPRGPRDRAAGPEATALRRATPRRRPAEPAADAASRATPAGR